MLTNLAITNQLLAYAGLEQFSHGTPDQQEAVRISINFALQKIFTEGPTWVRRTRWSEVLRGPQQLNGLTVAQYAKTIAGAGITSAMVGCTLRISNEALVNELESTTTLVRPILQANTSGATATVYGDSVALPANCLSLLSRPVVNGTAPLDPFFYREHQRYATDGTTYADGRPAYYFTSERGRVGDPVGYWVERVQVEGAAGILRQRLRVDPLPVRDVIVEADIELMATELSSDDIVGSGYVAMPAGLHESVLLPLAALKFATYPHFLESKRGVLEPEETIMARLRSADPQRIRGSRITPAFRMPHIRDYAAYQ